MKMTNRIKGDPFNDPDPRPVVTTTPEHTLMCEVIAQAIRDSKMRGTELKGKTAEEEREKRFAKLDAIGFLCTNRLNSYVYKFHIDLDPEIIKNKIRGDFNIPLGSDQHVKDFMCRTLEYWRSTRKRDYKLKDLEEMFL